MGEYSRYLTGTCVLHSHKSHAKRCTHTHLQPEVIVNFHLVTTLFYSLVLNACSCLSSSLVRMRASGKSALRDEQRPRRTRFLMEIPSRKGFFADTCMGTQRTDLDVGAVAN